MIRELIDAFKATRRPPTEADTRYVAATVRTSETIEGKVNTLNPRDYARVGRAVTGSIWNAATIIAREAAAGEIKLYRKASGKGRRVSKSAAAFLRGDGGTIRPAAKAMTYANEAEDIEEVTDHPALSLLRDPDPSTTSADFFTALYWFREVAGSAYIWTGGDKPTGLYLLLPQFTRVILDDKQGVTGYHYGRNETDTVMVPTSQVVASRWMPDPFNPYLGVSWVDSIKGYGDMEDAAIASEIHRWRNSAQPGMIVRVNNYAPDQMGQLAEAMRRKGGPFEAGKVTIINGSAEDIEIVQPNSKPHELNYERGIIQCEAAIYRAAGVPEPIWKMNDAIQSNAAHGSKVWMQSIYARQKAVASDLTEWLLPMFGVEPGEMWFAYPNPVVEDVASKATLLLAGFQAGVARVNEWRAVVGLDPVDDAENTLGKTIPALSVGLGKEPDAKPATPNVAGATPNVAAPDAAPVADVAATALNGAQVQALADLAAQVAQGQLPLASARAIAVAAFPMVDAAVIDAVFGPLASFTPEAVNEGGTNQQANQATGDDPEPPAGDGSGDSRKGHRGGKRSKAGGPHPVAAGPRNAGGRGSKGPQPKLIGRWEWSGKCGCGGCTTARKAEPTDDSIEGRIYRAVREWAADALRRGINGIGPDGSFDISSLSSAELEGLLRASITEAFRAGAVEIVAKYSPGTTPLASSAAQEYVKQYGFDLVKGVTETMANQMRTAIDAGLEQGKTINEIQADLTANVPDVSATRAEVIARTETARAYQHGSIKQAEELGFDSKTWDLAGEPCGLCEGAAAALGGKPVPIGEPFFKAGETITGTDGRTYTVGIPVMAASDIHPQCRCATIEMVTEAGE